MSATLGLDILHTNLVLWTEPSSDATKLSDHSPHSPTPKATTDEVEHSEFSATLAVPQGHLKPQRCPGPQNLDPARNPFKLEDMVIIGKARQY